MNFYDRIAAIGTVLDIGGGKVTLPVTINGEENTLTLTRLHFNDDRQENIRVVWEDSPVNHYVLPLMSLGSVVTILEHPKLLLERVGEVPSERIMTAATSLAEHYMGDILKGRARLEGTPEPTNSEIRDFCVEIMTQVFDDLDNQGI